MFGPRSASDKSMIHALDKLVGLQNAENDGSSEDSVIGCCITVHAFRDVDSKRKPGTAHSQVTVAGNGKDMLKYLESTYSVASHKKFEKHLLHTINISHKKGKNKLTTSSKTNKHQTQLPTSSYLKP